MLFSRGYSFHLDCFGNWLMIKFTFCIIKARLGGDFCQADVITHKGYSFAQTPVSKNTTYLKFCVWMNSSEMCLWVICTVSFQVFDYISKHLQTLSWVFTAGFNMAGYYWGFNANISSPSRFKQSKNSAHSTFLRFGLFRNLFWWFLGICGDK